MSPTIENFGKLLVLSSWRRLFTKNVLFGKTRTKLLVINNNEELAEIFSKHFNKLVENLDIDKTLVSNIANSDINYPAFSAIKKYKYHPSIKKNKHFMGGKDLQFSFNYETKNKILAKIHNLDNKKA